MIENPKIAALTPHGSLFERWQPAILHGVSLLYTPPGRSATSSRLRCDLDDSRLALYSALAAMVPKLDDLLTGLRPCWLPPSSYHTTFANSVNDLNLNDLDGGTDSEVRRYIRDLPHSLTRPSPADVPPARVDLPEPWYVRFRVQSVEVWPDAMAVVARLTAADNPSRRTLADLEAWRGTLNADRAHRGMTPLDTPAPHVTLAYFATAQDTRDADQRLRQADATRAGVLDLPDATIEHRAISLYGWTSMVDFFPHRIFGEATNRERYAAQSAIVHSALADPDHPLDRMLDLMRATDDAALYLVGSRQDHEFCFGSAELGVLLSVLPADSAKASVPGYHPGSTEVYVTFSGQLTLDWLDPADRCIRSSRSAVHDIVVLPPGRCHRVQRANDATAASLVVKTNVGHQPGVVRCDRCTYYPDPQQCALHNTWQIEQRAAAAD